MPKLRLDYNGDWVYTEKEKRINKLTQAIETKIDNIPGIVDDVNSTSTTDALSANMGKYLQDQINTITWLNKFLSTWDCTTGLPVTDPSAQPFQYTTWNYYIIAKVWWRWEVNYRPHWSTYTPWVASTAIEVEEVNINDFYIYDWSQWLLQVNKVKEIVVDDMLKPDSTNAVENRAIYSALTQKQWTIFDLWTIRDWAALWASSIQPNDNITLLTNNIGYQTAWDVNTAITNAISELAPEWVWRGVLTLQKNGTNIDTFSADAHSDKTINITMNKSDVGLSNVDNTSDLDKPISTATQTALNAITSDITDLQWDVSDIQTNYATKDYVDTATENSKYVWPTAPSNPEEWMLWYDTTNDQLKVYDWTTWVVTWKVYTAWDGISINNEVITNTWVLSSNNTYNNIVYMTQAEYDALQNKDPNTLYSTPDWADIQVVDDTPFAASWDWDTIHAPSKNAIYDILWGVETLLANI